MAPETRGEQAAIRSLVQVAGGQTRICELTVEIFLSSGKQVRVPQPKAEAIRHQADKKKSEFPIVLRAWESQAHGEGETGPTKFGV